MTEKQIIAFIESDKLERYLLGLADASEIKEVEQVLASSEEVRNISRELEENLEALARAHGVEAPAGAKERLLDQIGRASTEQKVVPISKQRRINWFGIAASIAFLIAATMAWQSNGKLDSMQQTNDALYARVNSLEATNDSIGHQLAQSTSQFATIANPATQKIILAGNQKADQLNIVAYWNKKDNQAHLHASNLPALPDNKCFQLWADVEGEMISLGVLLPNSELESLEFLNNAESLNITIEKAGGADHPNVSDLVASTSI